MDTLHTVLRSIRGETKLRRDHLGVFREFLSRSLGLFTPTPMLQPTHPQAPPATQR